MGNRIRDQSLFCLLTINRKLKTSYFKLKNRAGIFSSICYYIYDGEIWVVTATDKSKYPSNTYQYLDELLRDADEIHEAEVALLQ